MITELGKQFSVKGFGNKFRQWCDEAGLRGTRPAQGRRASLREGGLLEPRDQGVDRSHDR
ncbi:hypothetical protein [Sphingomonas faeni]|uniref:hypothetical protein n=1 Tax=Sphingomonas faeni TaxID=185950 RepID=UPI002785CAEB|nr:hypothetical protein [Sphingomonas faeni]MDQ0836245.1 hypothetical protein [Sphingomonas faeni]